MRDDRGKGKTGEGGGVQKALEIDIQPPVSVYATYRRLSYLPWYALAEFADNSTQNYYDHIRELKEAYKREKTRNFRIEIDYDRENNCIRIKDNANGMDLSELERAVKLNQPPQNPMGRCEFGMGLKTAACWFGRRWSIETKRFGGEEKYEIELDVEELSHQNNEKLLVKAAKAGREEHYTVINIFELYKPLNGRTFQRIKDQLSSMYREDLRTEEIEIFWNGAKLNFEEPPIFQETLPDSSKTIWKKNVEFDVPWERQSQVLHVKGWIGIRIPGSLRDAGFVLIRRGRVIIGGPENGYRPVGIFGQPNSYSYQRLIGELHLDEWPVSQSKDAFDWSGGLEDKFIELLKELAKDYIEKADGHRERPRKISKEEMQEAYRETSKVFQSKELLSFISTELAFPSQPVPPEKMVADQKQIKAVSEGPITITMELQAKVWLFRLFWQNQLSQAPWMSLEFPQENEIHIFLNSNHPFFEPYLDNIEMVALIQKLVISLALAEKMARTVSSNNKIDAADFRNYMNWVLRYAGKLSSGNND